MLLQNTASAPRATVVRNGIHAEVINQIAQRAYAHLPAASCITLLNGLVTFGPADIHAFRASWDQLEVDRYMGDGGRYRERRHAAYHVARDGGIERLPNRPHYQTVDYNPLNGGVARHFAPITAAIDANPAIQGLLRLASDTSRSLSPDSEWFVEAHQFRVIATPGGGKPTPEGAHRDGVSFVLMVLLDRENVTAGKTTIYDFDRRLIVDFVLDEAFEAAIVNDERVVHGVSPILPADLIRRGHRDVLVVTFRSDPA